MGAVIVGRRTDYFADGWGGSRSIPGAYSWLTHRPPDPPPLGSSSFTFVTDGIEPALDLAQEAADDLTHLTYRVAR